MKTRLIVTFLSGAALLFLVASLPAAVTAPDGGTTNAPAAKTNNPALLLPQDRLAFAIGEDPQRGLDPEIISVNLLNEIQVRISRTSDITLKFSTRDKTTEEVAREIKKAFDADYYVNSTVKLELRERAERFQRPGQILFLGEGVARGPMLLPGGIELRIFEAVHSRGVNEFANLKKVKLRRKNPETTRMDSTTYDLESMQKGDRSMNVILQDGDEIEVPERTFIIK